MLSIKQLHADEFHRLPIKADPITTIAVVAEDPESKEVKGYWLACGVVHVEPIWISEEVRDGGLTALAMLRTLLSTVAAGGDPVYYAFADRPEIANYLTRLGLKELPYKVFIGLNPLLEQGNQECLQQLSQPSSQVEPVSAPQL